MKRPLAYITAAWLGGDSENAEQAARYCRAACSAFSLSPLNHAAVMYARGRFIVNTSDILIRKFNPIPPPFPSHGKGGGSGGYMPPPRRWK